MLIAQIMAKKLKFKMAAVAILNCFSVANFNIADFSLLMLINMQNFMPISQFTNEL